MMMRGDGVTQPVTPLAWCWPRMNLVAIGAGARRVLAGNGLKLTRPVPRWSGLVRRRLSGTTTQGTSNDQTASFGFQEIPAEEKKGMVADVFHRVADNYDVMNDLMSAGQHRCWKDYLVKSVLRPIPGGRYLDVAGGTGDIAFRIISELNKRGAVDNKSEVIISDINESMLGVGKDRLEKRGLDEGKVDVEWVVGDAEQLPFEDNSMDAYTIAFGLRNVTDIDAALSEAYRVLKKGGVFLCMEFSQVPYPLVSQAYDMYSFNVIPLIGKVVANDHDAYKYLVESIRQFPNQEALVERVRAQGFKFVRYENLTLGVVAIHSAFKI